MSLSELQIAEPVPRAMPMGPDQVSTLLPQRFPFLFVDRIDEVVPMETARGVKGISAREPFLLPDDATVWPMPFVVESLGQLAIALLNMSSDTTPPPKVLLGNVSGVTYHRDVPLGCLLDLEVRMERFIGDQFITSGRASVDGALCMTMDSLICKIILEGETS